MATRIPHLELGGELGRGAHSAVYRGVRDGVAYAVKIPLSIDTEGDRVIAYRQFLREAVALARVHHPSLPAVMEVGRAGGIPYLIMELASGESLGERLERQTFTEAETLELARRVGGALNAIHAAGLVHRDVKPKNIVFDPETGTVKLVDLGSAAIADHDTSAAGTKQYAAPEVLAYESRSSDARMDLYSLGRVLLDCLGVPPLSRVPDAHGTNVLLAHGANPEFARVLLRLVAPDPAHRYADAAGLLEALTGLDGHSLRAPPSSRSAHRHRLLGRGLELDLMRRAWAESQRTGKLILLRGSAGSGKTELARAFMAEAAGGGTTVLAATCHPRAPRAFSVIRQLIEDYLRICSEKPPKEEEKALEALRRMAGDLASPLKLLSPTVARVFKNAPTVPASENAEQAFAEVLADFLEKMIRKIGPAIIFVDDVQWIDPSSRRVLSRAANRIGELRGLILLASRTEGGAEAETITSVLTTPVHRIDLAHLGDDDVIEMARDYLAARELELDVKQAVLRLSDGTPFGTLEVLRTLADEGVLLPYWGRWQLDAGALTAMHLPSEASSLLRRRIEALVPDVRAVLAAAAVIGSTFELDVLAKVSGPGALPSLTEARWSQLVEPAGEGAQRFIHQSVREVLLGVLDAASAAEIHQSVAEALDQRPAPPVSSLSHGFSRVPANESGDLLEGGGENSDVDADPLYRLAFHYGLGQVARSPARVAETNISAGLAAVRRFDNERATSFFEVAERALGLQNSSLDARTRLLLAEARLRVGEHAGALEEFQRVLGITADPFVRAAAYGRMAFVHVLQVDTTRARRALSLGFAELGEELPRESPLYAAGSVGAWVGGVIRKKVPSENVRSRSRDEILCALYYEAGRVAFSDSKPVSIILSAMRALEPADRLGPSALQARTYLMYAFVLTLAGLPGVGARYLETGEQIGRRLRDPVIYSHALQLHSVIAAWAGRFQDAIDAGAKCILSYGHWRELNDFIMVCYNNFQLEASRGRDAEAWRWLDVAIDRVNRHDGAPVVTENLLLAVRAGLVGLGREGDARVLFQRLERVTVPIPSDSGLYAMTFSPRVRRFTDKMDLGPEFQAIVAEFRSLNQDPKKAHLAVAEYYIHIAHAAVNRVLRATGSERARAVEELALPLSELRATARKFPVFRAHVCAVEGYSHFFHGRTVEAHTAFDEAERYAIQETVPWVQYAVYRGRAHLLREAGRHDGARDQAVLADSVAMEHGSVYRARWVREEFALRGRRGPDGEYITGSQPETAGFDETATFNAGGSRARRQLRALLRISRARAQELSPDHQSRVVVEELVQALRAERGFLFLTASVARASGQQLGDSEPGSDLVLIAGRDAAGHDLDEHEDYHRAVVREALSLSEDDIEERKARAATTARFCALAAPLVVDDLAAGVVYLDRPLAAGVFSDVDGEVLSALAGQVSVALELTRTLRARERAEESLRNAEKMEAVARLARGIAHDLNNMLSAIRLATVAMMTEPGVGADVGEDVRTIQSALQRANELTKQLGTFSRGELASPQLLRLHSRIERLLPVMEGLVGDTVDVVSGIL